MYKPLIVQSDMTLLLETDNESYESARDDISSFAEMVKSPEYMHTYRITPLSLWNAASAGITVDNVLEILDKYSKYPVSQTVVARVRQIVGRYGKVTIVKRDDGLYLQTGDAFIMAQLATDPGVSRYFIEEPRDNAVKISPNNRGHIKQALMAIQFPPEDLAGYGEGDKLDISLETNESFFLRDYQSAAVGAFYAGGKGGHGVIVLPCGAGKTVIGMAVMARLNTETLILTTSITAVRQWINELLTKTSLTPDQIGEYSGEKKEIRCVTVTTYQIISAKDRDDVQKHFELFVRRNWGFIVYDEVHTLPAPVFRVTAELQAKRRLGLTATLVREDGREGDVFALIGPKRYDLGWKVLESHGWIAKAECFELRVSMPDELMMPYAVADKRDKFRIAAENPNKLRIIRQLMDRHPNAHILIIGVYIDQLEWLAGELNAPLLTGKTRNKEREALYDAFRKGEIRALVVSKVANFAIDLPDANVAIEVSGSFGSRQEEAQRLGRILRPKKGENTAYFYMIVSAETREEEFSAHRQLFLIEQGYPYKIIDCEAE
ncbi:MAG: helicase-associated domain-containing protein [Clostridia bacterium]|nr:helicase-associated domain-containing protein [Clostridia bacterium]